MKGSIVAAAAAWIFLTVGAAVAQEAKRIRLRDLVSQPRTYFERPVRLPKMGCVDNPKDGFVCVQQVGGQMLRIEASALGAKTSQRIAERLIGDCKGTANLTRSVCAVEVEIVPRSSSQDMVETERGSVPLLTVYSPQIEMFAPR